MPSAFLTAPKKTPKTCGVRRGESAMVALKGRCDASLPRVCVYGVGEVTADVNVTWPGPGTRVPSGNCRSGRLPGVIALIWLDGDAIPLESTAATERGTAVSTSCWANAFVQPRATTRAGEIKAQRRASTQARSRRVRFFFTASSLSTDDDSHPHLTPNLYSRKAHARSRAGATSWGRDC